MTANDSVLRRYCRDVRSWLPGSRQLRKQVTTQLRDSVESYLEQEPNADFSQVRSHFGEPQAIAAAYVDNANTVDLLLALRVRRRVVATVTAVASAALVLWASVVTYAAIKEYRLNQAIIYITTEDVTTQEGLQTSNPDALYIVP